MMGALKRLYYLPVIHGLLFNLAQMAKVLICKWRYRRVLKRVRDKAKAGQKLRVLFLADDPSKWKCQSVYNEMVRSGRFEPVIALGLRQNKHYDVSISELREKRLTAKAFYERLGCKCIWAFDQDSKDLISMDVLRADLVFYQEPWMLYGCHTVMEVSQHALTCYVPYSVEWEMSVHLHWQNDFHKLLFADFVWDAELAAAEKPLCRACEIIGVGHPSFDSYLNFLSDNHNTAGYVIYAPHFAFPYKDTKYVEIFGTFEWNGREMLAFAKAHPEIKWAWKPHPSLRWQLEKKGFMTHQEVDAYYAEWERIARACYDGDYFDLFANSRAMITDSASFLMEYAPTQMPIIRLLAAQLTVQEGPVARKVFGTYYTARNWDELINFLQEIVLKKEDPQREVRLAAIRDAHLIGSHAGKKIVSYLTEKLCQ